MSVGEALLEAHGALQCLWFLETAKTKSRRRSRRAGFRDKSRRGQAAPINQYRVALGDVARAAAGLAFDGGAALRLRSGSAFRKSRLRVFGEDAGFLAGALEATQGKFERLVFADFDAGHTVISEYEKSSLGRPGSCEGTRDNRWTARNSGRAAYDSRRPCCGATQAHFSRMRVLGIETSCDETAAAVVSDTREIRSNVVFSQTAQHTPYGGVVPEIAARAHIEYADTVIADALSRAEAKLEEMDAIAVTGGPPASASWSPHRMAPMRDWSSMRTERSCTSCPSIIDLSQ